jgi:tetratricopeptide (TPR) repeat protein/DNA-binding XRE family transcriptional regulator
MATGESFGSLVRRYRRDAELTQEALAERAELSVRVIRTIESGNQHRPRQDTVRLLLEALLVPEGEQPDFWAAAGRLGWNSMLPPELVVQGTHDPGGRAASPRLPGGFLGAHPAAPLVGREAEHARLVAMLDAAGQGVGRLVAIAGEPGAGKTRLAQELTLDLEARGFLVATGRCFERQGRIPYAPFLDALPSLYAAAPASVRRQAAERWPYLAPLLPDELPPVRGSGTDAVGDQLRVFRALTRFLLALAEDRPVAVLLDDLHWADMASLDLLRYLALNTRETRVFLAGMHRPVDRRHALQTILRELAHDGLLDQIAVHPLDRAGTAGLLDAHLTDVDVSDQLIDLIHQQAEGNPFFTIEIVRALVERGDIAQSDDGWAAPAGPEIVVPESVRSVIDERVGRLPEGVQTLLGQASVLGHTFTTGELVALSGQGVEEVEGVLETAAEAALLRERAGEDYAFSHVLVQQALYADLSGARRRRLHRMAGVALEALPERQRRAPAELAWHFREGQDAERALPWTLLAGGQAEAAFGYAEAEAQHRLAVGLAAQLGATEVEAAAREKLAVSLANLGRADDAIREADAAVRLYRQLGDLAGEVRTAGYRANSLGGPERHAVVRDRLETLRPRLEALGPTSSLADLYFNLGALVGDYEGLEPALELAARGSEVARAVGDRTALFNCELLRGNVLYMLGRAGEAESVLQRLLDAENWDGAPPDWRGSAGLHLGMALAIQGKLTEGIYHAKCALEVSERADTPLGILYTLNLLVLLEFLAGNWEAARRHAQRVLAITESLPREGWLMPIAITCLGKIALCQGSIEEGERRLLEVLERASDLPDFVAEAAVGLADYDLFAGRAEAALRRLASLPRSLRLKPSGLVDVLARAHLASGDLMEAEAILVEWIEVCKAEERAAYIDALWSLGMVWAAGERWAEADSSFGEAVGLAREMPYPYAEARALYHWGLDLHRQHRVDESRERLEGALILFRRLGATPYMERVEQALASLGA